MNNPTRTAHLTRYLRTRHVRYLRKRRARQIERGQLRAENGLVRREVSA